ncbi:ion transporter [Pantoea coffeiphila]|uniref:Transporter n=1 Tax=Pantoea coffeiphila TaxID=1465635 RepID=A0A2S9I581_9GAMM|nr:ion transporter [Pantoea coffeiphila]PRD12958.1 transporter [Pantoea coffeiphila]
MPDYCQGLRGRIYAALFDSHTRSGHYAERFWILSSLISVILVFVESGTPGVIVKADAEISLFILLEYLFTAVFSLEYLLRLITSRHPLHYAFSFFGVVDLITALPLYIYFFWPEIALQYMMALRLLRVLRLLRLIKVLRYIGSASVMWDSLYSARKKLMLFFGVLIILLCLFGGLMYVIEGPEHGFTSLPVSLYWATVTLTTVGYGDITPHTGLGRIVSSILILLGYSLIAIPTGVMSSYMTEVMQRRRKQRICPHCKESGHENDAQFCKSCGSGLPPESDEKKPD